MNGRKASVTSHGFGGPGRPRRRVASNVSCRLAKSAMWPLQTAGSRRPPRRSQRDFFRPSRPATFGLSRWNRRRFRKHAIQFGDDVYFRPRSGLILSAYGGTSSRRYVGKFGALRIYQQPRGSRG